jgi:hypothetical protein
MGSGKLRVLACRGVTALGVTLLAAACGTASASPVTSGAGQAENAPVLGALRLGAFPSTLAGTQALTLCQQWAGLRGAYADQLRHDTPYELEQWFSSAAWRPAFTADDPLRTGTSYIAINTAFGLASTAAAASIGNAQLLDQACAAAD